MLMAQQLLLLLLRKDRKETFLLSFREFAGLAAKIKEMALKAEKAQMTRQEGTS